MTIKTSSMFASVLAVFAIGCVQPQACRNGTCAPGNISTTSSISTSETTAVKVSNSSDSVLQTVIDGDDALKETTPTNNQTSASTDTKMNQNTSVQTGTMTSTIIKTSTATSTGTDSYHPTPIQATEAEITAILAAFDGTISHFRKMPYEDLKDSVDSLVTTLRTFHDARDAKIAELSQVQQMRQQATADLLTQLQALATQREAARLQKYRELEARELAILDPLTAEGGPAQISWDHFFAKLDVVRELSVKSEVLATRDEMLHAIDAMYFADHPTLRQFVEAIIATNLSLIDASAPANAIVALKKLALLEDKMQLATTQGDTAQITWLASQIHATQQRIKLPLDAIDTKIFPDILAMLATTQTVEGEVASVNHNLQQVDDLLTRKRDFLREFEQLADAGRSAGASLWPLRIQNPGNRGYLYVGVTAVNRLFPTLAAITERIRLAINTIAKAKVKDSLAQDALQSIAADAQKATRMFAAIRTTMEDLKSISQSTKICTAHQPIHSDDLITQILRCSDDDHEVLYTVVK